MFTATIFWNSIKDRHSMSPDTHFEAIYIIAISIISGLLGIIWFQYTRNKNKEKSEEDKQSKEIDELSEGITNKLELFTKEFNTKLYHKLDVISLEIKKISEFNAVQNLENTVIKDQLSNLRNDLNLIWDKFTKFENTIKEQINTFNTDLKLMKFQHHTNHPKNKILEDKSGS